MSDVKHRLREDQESDPSVAYELLSRFLVAADALSAGWNPVLDHGYPRYLPSFDDFLKQLSLWKEEVKERQAAAEAEDILPLNFADPAAVQRWLKELRAQVEDAVAAGEDATRPFGKRGLGRLMARRMVIEARHALLELLQAAERGIG
jgi:hypothetical protein